MIVTTTWTNSNPNTIFNQLAARLGRTPTDDEAIAEVKRLMSENTRDMAAAGKLPHQRKR